MKNKINRTTKKLSKSTNLMSLKFEGFHFLHCMYFSKCPLAALLIIVARQYTAEALNGFNKPLYPKKSNPVAVLHCRVP